jgi:hypothetical protein
LKPVVLVLLDELQAPKKKSRTPETNSTVKNMKIMMGYTENGLLSAQVIVINEIKAGRR